MLDVIIIGLFLFFFCFIPAMIIYVVNEYYSDKCNEQNKHLFIISTIVIFIVVAICYIENWQSDYYLKNIIYNSNSIEEIQEKVSDYFDD